MNDWIERRFGRYRQFHGGNFLVSVRQVLQAEKKIRVSSLLKFHQFKLNDLAYFNDDERLLELYSYNITANVSSMFNLLSSTDRNIILYVGGYVAYTLSKRSKCTNCNDFLTESDFLDIEYDANILDESDTFLLQLRSRGGLKCPSSFVYSLTSYAYCVFGHIRDDNEFQIDLFYIGSVIMVLSHITLKAFNKEFMFDKTCCDCDLQQLSSRVLFHAFNVFVKNYALEMSDSRLSASSSYKRRKFVVSQ